MNSSLLDGQTALVTGASRGIGRAIAIEAGRNGAQVIGSATSEQGAQVIQSAFDAAGVNGQGIVLDVGDTASVEDSARTLKASNLTPSILVNNAGITRDALLMRMSSHDWDDVINVNLSSLYRMNKAFIRGMMKQRFGRIINISSVVGATGNAGQANYAAAKAGMIGFTKALAREVGPRGITVNAVAPGFIDTEMTQSLDDSQRTALLSTVPLGVFGQVSDIAAAVMFLASPQAAYITGETLHVNGGMHMG